MLLLYFTKNIRSFFLSSRSLMPKNIMLKNILYCTEEHREGRQKKVGTDDSGDVAIYFASFGE
jgi:hypothetical protein